MLTVRPQEQYAALQEARARQSTSEYAKQYVRRAGIEGTLSRSVRTCEIRRTRYVGQAKVHLGHLLAATALNLLRLCEWLAEVPRARTRCSPFTRIMAQAA